MKKEDLERMTKIGEFRMPARPVRGEKELASEFLARRNAWEQELEAKIRASVEGLNKDEVES